ncbi:MAG: hypothetical protein ABSD30_05630 [Candidatus Binatus sp.]
MTSLSACLKKCEYTSNVTAGLAWPSRCCTSVIGASLAIIAEAQL